MRLQDAFVAAFLGATATCALAPAVFAQPVPYPNHPQQPLPNDPAHDPLALHRHQLRHASSQLFSATNSFHRLARQRAETSRVVFDRYYGRRVIRSIDPRQNRAIQHVGRLLKSVSQFSTYQSRYQNCGVYERRNGLCSQSLAMELALLRNIQLSFHNFRANLNELNAARDVNGQQLVQQIGSAMQSVVTIFRQAGLLNPAPRPPRPQPPQPAPRPNPNPVPPQQPVPPPAPAPVPADPVARLNQARAAAELILSQARTAQEQAKTYRETENDRQAIEAIDALEKSAENLVNTLRTLPLEQAKLPGQELEVQYNATQAAVQIALQSSSNLSGVAQLISQTATSVNQLVALLEISSNTQPPAGSPTGPGGYRPGDRPPYEER